MPGETMFSETVYEFAFEVKNLEDAQPFQSDFDRGLRHSSLRGRELAAGTTFERLWRSEGK